MNQDPCLSTEEILQRLEHDGVVVLPGFVPAATLAGMQRSFAAILKQQRWNDVAGYEKTEKFRHMVQDVLTLEQGFVDIALEPRIKQVLHAYIGPGYQLCEAKGWLSVPTREDFHGWHGDMWYDQQGIGEVAREVKLAIYLTDVRSGAFQYLKGTHGQTHPRVYRSAEVESLVAERRIEALGQAGTAIIFDTSGTHRQGAPILEPRHAVFYNYHDPSLPLQAEDVAYNRYHPLLLNAAFLGGLDGEDRRILGFGDKRQYQPGFERRTPHSGFHGAIQAIYDFKLALAWRAEPFTRRLNALLNRAR